MQIKEVWDIKEKKKETFDAKFMRLIEVYKQRSNLPKAKIDKSLIIKVLNGMYSGVTSKYGLFEEDGDEYSVLRTKRGAIVALHKADWEYTMLTRHLTVGERYCTGDDDDAWSKSFKDCPSMAQHLAELAIFINSR